MLVQITVRINGRKAGLVELDLRGSAAELEEQRDCLLGTLDGMA